MGHPIARQTQKPVSSSKAPPGSFMNPSKPKYLKQDRKRRLDRPSLGGRVHFEKKKNRFLQSSFNFAPIGYSQLIKRYNFIIFLKRKLGLNIFPKYLYSKQTIIRKYNTFYMFLFETPFLC